MPRSQTRSGPNVLSLSRAPAGWAKPVSASKLRFRPLRDFVDGTWLIELAGLADGVEVPAAVAAVLGVSQQPDRSLWGSVCDGCRYRQTLLVFDNAEHIVDEMAALTVELLGAAPGVKVLVTSREALGTPGEQIYPVRPLPVNDEAVALFADRARAVRPDFAVVAENAEAVSEVCRHLDGIPLGDRARGGSGGVDDPAGNLRET